MTRHRHTPCTCPDSERAVCECRRTDPDVEWLALQHGMDYAALAEMLGDESPDAICISCLVWLTGTESVVCSWCRD